MRWRAEEIGGERNSVIKRRLLDIMESTFTIPCSRSTYLGKPAAPFWVPQLQRVVGPLGKKAKYGQDDL